MKKVYLAAIAGNLGMLTIGQFSGWTSPSLSVLTKGSDAKYPFRLTADEASWVASFLTLGATAGSIICGFMVNVIGRKNTMLFTALPSIISWLMIAFATSPWELYISRFISGLSTGIAYLAMPMYLGEISPPDIRGNLTSMFTVAGKLGTLIEFVIGPFLSVQNLAFVSLIGPCLFVAVFIWLPESPHFFLRHNNRQKAINSLIQLRDNKENIHEEINNIEQYVKADLANKSGFRELLFVPGNRRAVIILLFLVWIQQFSGVNAVIQYSQIILDRANTNLEGKYLTMIIGAIQMIFTIVCMFLSDCSGRRLLLMISAAGAALSTCMVAIYFNLEYSHIDTSNIIWLPAIGTIMYVIMYGLGLAPLPFTMASELFPTNVKALGITTILTFMHLWAFTVLKLYMVIAESYGTHVPFWIFTMCSLVGTLIVLFYVPETKGKTLEQIQKELHASSKQ
ncbi:facilitated trehalose transporter Tret1-like [Nylanderia fulva]|uniref:facilitated trehalose transporter Tret1-like n=1 Tax=Nylanderia fulva TaxID=613905 RepID=UPI0010FB0F75|nr:facilitated trehalose transporter Tret1-like [Nylanderia fulva]